MTDMETFIKHASKLKPHQMPAIASTPCHFWNMNSDTHSFSAAPVGAHWMLFQDSSQQPRSQGGRETQTRMKRSSVIEA